MEALLVLLCLYASQSNVVKASTHECSRYGNPCFELIGSARASFTATHSEAKEHCRPRGTRGGSLAVPDSIFLVDILRRTLNADYDRDDTSYVTLTAWVGYEHAPYEMQWLDGADLGDYDYIRSEEVQSRGYRWDNPPTADRTCFYLNNNHYSQVNIESVSCEAEKEMQAVCQLRRIPFALPVPCLPVPGLLFSFDDDLFPIHETSAWCYYKYPIAVNFSVALDFCQSLVGFIFAPTTKLEAESILALTWESSYANDTWIGLESVQSKPSSSGSIRSSKSSDEPAQDSGIVWAPYGPPSPLDGKECVLLSAMQNSSSSLSLSYSMAECDTKHPYICSHNYAPGGVYCQWQFGAMTGSYSSVHSVVYGLGFSNQNAYRLTNVMSIEGCRRKAEQLRDIMKYDVKTIVYDSLEMVCEFNMVGVREIGGNYSITTINVGERYTMSDVTCYNSTVCYPQYVERPDQQYGVWDYYFSHTFTEPVDYWFTVDTLGDCIQSCENVTSYATKEHQKCRGVVFRQINRTCGISHYHTLREYKLPVDINNTDVEYRPFVAVPRYCHHIQETNCSFKRNRLRGVRTTANITDDDDVFLIASGVISYHKCAALLIKKRTVGMYEPQAANYHRATGVCQLINSTTWPEFIELSYKENYIFTGDNNDCYLESSCRGTSKEIDFIIERDMTTSYVLRVYDIQSTNHSDIKGCRGQCEILEQNLPRMCKSWTYYPDTHNCMMSTVQHTVAVDSADNENQITGYHAVNEGWAKTCVPGEYEKILTLTGLPYEGIEPIRIYGYAEDMDSCSKLCQEEYHFYCLSSIWVGSTGWCGLYNISFGDVNSFASFEHSFHKADGRWDNVTTEKEVQIWSSHCYYGCNMRAKHHWEYYVDEIWSEKVGIPSTHTTSMSMNACIRECEENPLCKGISYEIRNDSTTLSAESLCRLNKRTRNELLGTAENLQEHTKGMSAFWSACPEYDVPSPPVPENTTGTQVLTTTLSSSKSETMSNTANATTASKVAATKTNSIDHSINEATATATADISMPSVSDSTTVASIESYSLDPTSTTMKTVYSPDDFVCHIGERYTEFGYFANQYRLDAGTRSSNIVESLHNVPDSSSCEAKCIKLRKNCHKPCRAYEYNSKTRMCMMSMQRVLSTLEAEDAHILVGVVSNCDAARSCGITRQSHTWNMQFSYYATDDSPTTCASTGNNRNAYWLMVMPSAVKVFGVNITTAHSLTSFELRVGEQGKIMSGNGYNFIENRLCQRVGREHISMRSLHIPCISERLGSVISVHLTGQERSMSICDITVY